MSETYEEVDVERIRDPAVLAKLVAYLLKRQGKKVMRYHTPDHTGYDFVDDEQP